MIHFDDGFLDNWSVVYPVMERLTLKYSVLVSTDFLDPGSEIRPFVSETTHANKAHWWGYLNASEIRTMEASGLVDVQSHAKTHTWYETGPEVVGRHADRGVFAPWLHWNRWPDRKHAWLTHDWARDIPAGTPILRNAKSLEAKRFFRSEAYDEYLARGKDHIEATRALGSEQALGRYETEGEWEARVEDELMASKTTLEAILNKQIIGLVWPGGGCSLLAMKKARQAGYLLMSKGDGLNQFASNACQIRRLAGTLSTRGVPLRVGQRAFLRAQLLRGVSGRMDALSRWAKCLWR